MLWLKGLQIQRLAEKQVNMLGHHHVSKNLELVVVPGTL
jgi:hypothetical protein